MLAIRVGLLDDDEQYQQNRVQQSKAEFAAINFQADLLGKGNHTSVRAKIESGTMSSDNPRQLPPNDQLTSWYAEQANLERLADPRQGLWNTVRKRR